MLLYVFVWIEYIYIEVKWVARKTVQCEIKERERWSIIKIKYPTQENIFKYKSHKNLILSNQRKAEVNFYEEQFELIWKNNKDNNRKR